MRAVKPAVPQVGRTPPTASPSQQARARLGKGKRRGCSPDEKAKMKLVGSSQARRHGVPSLSLTPYLFRCCEAFPRTNETVGRKQRKGKTTTKERKDKERTKKGQRKDKERTKKGQTKDKQKTNKRQTKDKQKTKNVMVPGIEPGPSACCKSAWQAPMIATSPHHSPHLNADA
jgi:hypothetical protein